MSLGNLFGIFLLLIIALALLLFRKSSRKTNPYAGGEKIDFQEIPYENFYQTFYKFFPRTYQFLENLHDEDLHNYIYLILLTTALLLLLTLIPGVWL